MSEHANRETVRILEAVRWETERCGMGRASLGLQRAGGMVSWSVAAANWKARRVSG